MEAVVMAAGEGRRLRPLTERWPKPVLPIDGRPILAVLLRELAAAGIGPVTIVVGHLAAQVRALAGDGAAFGLEARYADQPEPLGSADAVRRALAAGAHPPLLVVAADTVFTPGDLARFSAAAPPDASAGALALRTGLRPTAEKPGVRVRDGQVEAVVDLDPELPYTSAPLWVLREPALRLLDIAPGPPFELKDPVQAAIDSGETLAGVEIGATRDLTRPEDLVEANFPYIRAL
jgi:UDP-N-acetylglucosamine diphosphorylase / glucose-1-phosphate thymidylyltransferase / UDP-N-acetylgalactosamine diphosphorylase / glucosamine-1-phosphate N-acetyltransferase / galactosamine-1-phosphate N-acetyltransferase